MNHSSEQVADSIIKTIQKVIGAHTTLTQDTLSGTSTLIVDNSFHFNDAESVILIDSNPEHVEYHSVLKIVDTSTILLVNNVQSDFRVSNTATLYKAIGGVPLPENAVLFGDRKVIPNPDITITVDPEKIGSIEWVVVPGGLSVEYSVTVTAYVKLDESEAAHRIAAKYGDALFEMFNKNLHFDIVNDEVRIVSDVSAGSVEIEIPSLVGWSETDTQRRYEVQDNNHSDIDFIVLGTLDSPPRVILDRPVEYDFKVSDRAIFRRRTRYIYNSLTSEVNTGYIQKGSAMYKAARITWWGKETGDYQFPQTTHGGIT
jgi:hypothetical protein